MAVRRESIIFCGEVFFPHLEAKSKLQNWDAKHFEAELYISSEHMQDDREGLVSCEGTGCSYVRYLSLCLII